MTAAGDALEALLALDPETVAAEQRQLWLRATGESAPRIVLFGAGQLGLYTLRGLARIGIRPIAIADNASHLWNSAIEGIDVLSPDEAVRRYGGGATFVIATYNTSGPRRQLAALGVTPVPYAWLFAHFQDALLPYWCLEEPGVVFRQAADIRRAFALMSGEDNRAAFLTQLRLRLFLDFDRPHTPTEEMRKTEYFPSDLYRYRDDEVLVDCGAYDGDTIRRFLQARGEAFRLVHACEPDPASRRRLEAWLATLPPAVRARIRIEPFGVGSARRTMRFAATGTVVSGIDDAGGATVEIATIDELTAAAPPTLIKMDIEGAELDGLDGARRSINRSAPVLAVCVYHTCDHLWQVPLRIASMSDRYRLHLRAHAEDCWDVTCYAVPDDRIKD